MLATEILNYEALSLKIATYTTEIYDIRNSKRNTFNMYEYSYSD